MRGVTTSVLALIFGLGLGTARDREMFSPPGYPLLEEFSECSQPGKLDDMTWLLCMFELNW